MWSCSVYVHGPALLKSVHGPVHGPALLKSVHGPVHGPALLKSVHGPVHGPALLKPVHGPALLKSVVLLCVSTSVVHTTAQLSCKSNNGNC